MKGCKEVTERNEIMNENEEEMNTLSTILQGVSLID